MVSVAACSSSESFVTHQSDLVESVPLDAGRVVNGIYLIGDLPVNNVEASTKYFDVLRTNIASDNFDKSTIVVLGDFVPPKGLPDSGSTGWGSATHNIEELRRTSPLVDKIIFLNGDNEWTGGRRGGLTNVRSLSDHFRKLDDKKIRFATDDGFPGPVPIDLGDDLLLITIDSQWWLHRFEKPFGDAGDYDLDEPSDFLVELEDVLRKNNDKIIILSMHHPIRSNGIRAGHFPLSYHFRPLPILGTVSALYRKLVGRPQDLQSKSYHEFRDEIQHLIARHENLIVAAAHDPGLQYIVEGPRHTQQHHVTSAAARPATNITPDSETVYASTSPGYAVVELRDDRSVTLFIRTFDDTEDFRSTLFQETPPTEIVVEKRESKSFPTEVVTPINSDYDLGSNIFVNTILGKHYRKAWAAPVNLKVLDMSTEHGGLDPIKIGGRGQSLSLRVVSPTGREYVMRTVDKEAGRAWSKELRKTFANAITQDQISLLFPYAALVIPPLADAIGVYHTNPRLFYVPDDPLLGSYREIMADRIVLFEERPDEDLSDLDSFGNTKNAVSYRTMFRKIDDDNDNRVDQRAFARARLFDILISDWDRHEDQWRWAEFKNPDKGSTYRPIPRDRDVAFMLMDGALPKLAQLASLRNWQDFDYDYGYLKGLTRNGVSQDRRLTAELTTSDWVAIADDIRLRLTDEIIQQAFYSLPDTISSLYADRMIDILKHRRDNLPAVALQFSRLLAKDVDVVGSNKHEEFVVERFANDSTRVTVYKTKKDGERLLQIYRRTFYRSETDEIFLFGQGGQDRFSIRGEVDKGIRISVIGGAGQDVLTDSSAVSGLSKKTIFYDTPSNTFTTSRETKLRVRESPSVNRYNPRAYKFNGIKPIAFLGSNKDDGFFFGGGFVRTIHGFRKSPFKAQHTFAANVATLTGAFNVKYSADYRSVVEKTDVRFDSGVFTPNNIRNFYGLGNESRNDSSDASYYQSRLSKADARVRVTYHITDFASFSAGPTFNYTDVRLDSSRFVNTPQAGISPNTFEDQLFAGVSSSFQIKSVDNPTNPQNGFQWTSSASTNFGIRNTSSTFSTFESDLRVYFPVSYRPQVTLAARTGGRHIEGAFPFYTASTLGGTTNLRGYRGTRFAGRSAAFYNLELRMSLFNFSSYLSFGRLGINAFYDGGRVWTDGESSELWHRGYGGGLWTFLFDSIMLSTAYAESKEESTFSLGLGFQF